MTSCPCVFSFELFALFPYTCVTDYTCPDPLRRDHALRQAVEHFISLQSPLIFRSASIALSTFPSNMLSNVLTLFGNTHTNLTITLPTSCQQQHGYNIAFGPENHTCILLHKHASRRQLVFHRHHDLTAQQNLHPVPERPRFIWVGLNRPSAFFPWFDNPRVAHRLRGFRRETLRKDTRKSTRVRAVEYGGSGVVLAGGMGAEECFFVFGLLEQEEGVWEPRRRRADPQCWDCVAWVVGSGEGGEMCERGS